MSLCAAPPHLDVERNERTASLEWSESGRPAPLMQSSMENDVTSIIPKTEQLFRKIKSSHSRGFQRSVKPSPPSRRVSACPIGRTCNACASVTPPRTCSTPIGQTNLISKCEGLHRHHKPGAPDGRLGSGLRPRLSAPSLGGQYAEAINVCQVRLRLVSLTDSCCFIELQKPVLL